MTTDFRQFFDSLDPTARAGFAAEAGTTAEYIRHHLLAGRRMPRRALLDKLVAAASRRGAQFKPEQVLASLMAAGEGRAV